MIAVKRQTSTAPPDRTISPTVRLGERRTAEKGDEVTITGPGGGRYRFHAHVLVHDTGSQWVDVWGPVVGKRQAMRSFTLDRVGAIHRTTKGRP